MIFRDFATKRRSWFYVFVFICVFIRLYLSLFCTLCLRSRRLQPNSQINNLTILHPLSPKILPSFAPSPIHIPSAVNLEESRDQDVISRTTSSPSLWIPLPECANDAGSVWEIEFFKKSKNHPYSDIGMTFIIVLDQTWTLSPIGQNKYCID